MGNRVILEDKVEVRILSVGSWTCQAWGRAVERNIRRRGNLPVHFSSGCIVNNYVTVICKMECYS